MALTDDQVSRTLEHINYPKSKHASDPLQLLRELMLHFVARVPFETIGLHYSTTHRLSVKQDDLFEKIVVRSKGGYCVELNNLFALLMRALDFNVLTVGGRVRAGQERYTGWSHMCSIVTIDSQRYQVDVGYGADSSFQPIPLQDGYEFTIFAPRRGKLEYRSIDHHTDPSQRLWVYSMQEDALSEWKEQYAFVETEFFQGDYEMTNYFCSTSPDSFFSFTVFAMRAIVEEGQLKGILTLYKDVVRRRVGGTRETLETLTTEEDRVKALAKYFDMPLTEEEKQGIHSTGLALGQK